MAKKRNNPDQPFALSASIVQMPHSPAPSTESTQSTSSDSEGAINRAPTTMDIKARTVGVTMLTETPIPYSDYQYGRCSLIMLMSGCQLPASGKVPMCDSHDTYSTESIYGSGEQLAIGSASIGGQTVKVLTGVLRFASDQPSTDRMNKMAEGHITDVSIGCKTLAETFVEEGETYILDGVSYQGPTLLVTSWALKEVSLCAVGRDVNAKVFSTSSSANIDSTSASGGSGGVDSGTSAQGRDLSLSRSENGAGAGSAENTGSSTEPSPITLANQNTPPKENRTMNPKVRALLIKLGLDPAASEADALAFAETVDPESIKLAAATEATKKEAARLGEISLMLADYDVSDEFRTKALAVGTTPAAVAHMIVKDKIALSDKVTLPASRSGAPATHGEAAYDKHLALVEDAFALRAGVKVEKADTESIKLASYPLMEVLRRGIEKQGRTVPETADETIKLSLSSSDLTAVLGNVANKSMLAGFALKPASYNKWVDTTGNLRDFKLADLTSLSEVDDLLEIPEGGEIKSSAMYDHKEQVRLVTWGRKIMLTRQMIINDDMSALSNLRTKQATAYERLLNRLSYTTLIANAAMADGDDLFHANHGNYQTSGAPVDKDELTDAFFAMGIQKDPGDFQALDIVPQFFIAPKAQEGAAEDFFLRRSLQVGTTLDAIPNRFGGDVLTRVYEPYLDGFSAKKWYLAAEKGMTVQLFFLNGQKVPFVDTEVTKGTRNVEFSIVGDVAAKAVDFRGLYLNDGE